MGNGTTRRGAGNASGRHSAYDAGWRQLHPERAREERAFRLEQAERRRDHAERDRLKDPGTPETRQKMRRHMPGAIARMAARGHIDADQLHSACTIRAVAERIAAGLSVRTMSMETRIDGGRLHDTSFFEALGAVRAEVAYGSWRRGLGRHAAAVLAVIVDDQPCSATARGAGMADAKLRRSVTGALDTWPLHYRDACDWIDEDRLGRFQARVA